MKSSQGIKREKKSKDEITWDSSAAIHLIIAFVIVRVVLGILLGSWFDGGESWDEGLLASYADLPTHFQYHFNNAMLKYMGYPLFLWLVHKSVFIPYTAWLSLLWSAGGVLAWVVFRKMGVPKKAAFLIFLYMTFMPEAFEVDAGTKMYRQAIIGPCSLITFLLLIDLFLCLEKYEKNRGKCLLVSFLTGISASFTYFIKEDGLWILACLLFAAAVCTIRQIILHRKTKGRVKVLAGRILCIAVPLVCLGLVSLGYRAVNKKYYGVFLTNTRTGGEAGEFLKKVYSIESEDRTDSVWAPADAIEKAFAASATLSAHEELLGAIKTTDWFSGNIEEIPITGDFLGWVLVSEYYETFPPENTSLISEKKAFFRQREEFFRQVNRELSEAFRNGTLKKETGRIRFLRSAGSKSVAEIEKMIGQIGAGYAGAICLSQYQAGIREVNPDRIEDFWTVIQKTADMTHQPYLMDYLKISSVSKKTAKIINGIFWIYRIVNVLLAVGTAGWLVWILIRLIMKKKVTKFSVVCAFISLVFAGIAFAYDFSIAWFSSFLMDTGVKMNVVNYYNVAMPVLLGLSYCFGVSGILGGEEKTKIRQ